MRKLYFKPKMNNRIAYLALLMALLLGNIFAASAQVRVPFTQRTSQYSPTKKIYNVKGDFTMIGNTNLTLQSYGDQTQNGFNNMRYVDIDAATATGLGGTPTFNSSASTLQLSTENGAEPGCSNIVYAGLYWTGRASNSNPSNDTFSVTKTVQTGTQNVNNDGTYGDDDDITNSSYGLNITRAGGSNNRNPVYTFSGNGVPYVFNFSNNTGANAVTLSVNGGAAVNIPVTLSTSGNTKTATLTTPYSFTDGTVTVTIKTLVRDGRLDRTTTETEDTSFSLVNVTGSIPVNGSITKNFDKRKIMFKGPGASGYTQFLAGTNDIYYPTATDDYMYSAYAEVTDYVKTHGIGEYMAADIAMIEGNGGGTGYYGGWGLIVVYENSKMKYRDVTIFDGHAFVVAGTANYDIAINGFNTVQGGPVGVKLGVMAGEGDRDITGDYFQIKKQSDGVFSSLTHAGNVATNFFNSSIQTGGNPRNPSLLNNTGLDISMFNIDNPSNSVITNNQTSTTFKYGSTGDTYIIFAVAMAVDAYIPDIEANISTVSINGVPAGTGPYTVLPGQDLEYKIQIRNRGTEAINNMKITIPVPYNATYVPNSATKNVYFTPLPTPNSLTFEPTVGSNGSVVWNFGTLPLPANPETILADLTFKFKATTDCTLLKNASCNNILAVNGNLQGTGAITGIGFNEKDLIQGYTTSGNCQGTAISAPIIANINATEYVNQNCQSTPPITAFVFCNAGATIPITSVSGSFPAGSTFYNQYPVVSGTTTQYTIANPFPGTVGTNTYYAVPPGVGQGCYFQFTITVTSITSQPTTADVSYCVGAVAQPLTATPSTPGYILYYYTGLNSSPQLSITPSTATAGTTTYYVAEGQSSSCIGPKKAIVVTVYPAATIVAPAAATVSGCGTNAITGLVYSSNPVVITLAQFTAAGGTLPNNTGIGNYTITYSDTQSGTCPIQVVRTFSVTTLCGTVSATQNITVSDTVAPVAPQAPAAVTVTCAANVPANVTLTATDNCNGAVPAQGVDVITPGACANKFTVTRTWTFTDACGNSSSVSQTINVNDTVAPVAPQAPATVTVACAADVPANVTLTANDNCGGSVSAQGVDVVTPGACANKFTVTRTWTFADACGNSSSVSQIINVNDTIAPVAPAAPAAVTVACAADVPANVTLTANDNCGGSVSAQGVDVVTPGACANKFTVTRTWTFTDACGNSSSVSQTITVNDTVAPVAPQAPAAVTVACAADVPANVTLTANDNCGGSISAQGVDVVTPGACANKFTVTRTWTFADACGNSSSVSQIINVNDTVAPVAPQAPAAVTVACAGDVPANVTLTANDNCGGSISAQGVDVVTPGACANKFTVTRTWTFADACGNSSSVSQTINVNDTVAPVAPAAPAAVTVACAGDVPAMISLTANDNCNGEITVAGVDVVTPGACANKFTVTRTWTFTDACGNSSSVSQIINVNDTVAPVAPAAPETVTVACAADVPANVTLTANDNCGGSVSAQGVDVVTPGACANKFTVTRTWTFADACGNSSSVSQTITVNDTVAPVAPQAPAAVTVACAGDVPANVTLTANDNCSGEITVAGVDVITPGACANKFTVTRTWTFADACGNSSSVSQTINVNDTIAPVAPAAPAAVTVACAADVPAMISLTANDNCNGEITVAGVDVITPGACANKFTVTRTWTFADACGNSSSVSQTINVNDTVAPVAPQAPAAVTVACAADVPANVTLTANDNCGGSISAQGVDVVTPGACANKFTVTRTWTFTDACGNTSSVSQTINVDDTVAPVISQLPAVSTIDCPAAPVFAQATATDNCVGQVTLTFEDVRTEGTCASAYSVTRTWTATDVCGNTSTATQTINVQDITAPVIGTQASNLTIQCGVGNENALNDWLATHAGASATDTCSAVTWSNNYNGISNDCTAAVTVIFTATDACGNTATTSATFTVQDTTAPVAPAAPAAVTVACAADVPANVTLTATDNCAGSIAVQGVDVVTPGQCANSFTVTRTWTFTDACANSSSVSQIITVNDTIAPVAPQAPATVTVACAADVPAMVSLTANDNCSGEITVAGVDVVTPGQCANSFTVTRTWTFADACGNTSSVSQTINVNDTIAPVAPAAPETVTVACAADVPAMVSLTANDNCSGEITVAGVDVVTPGQCANSFTVTRTWTFADACGNTSSVSQTINVNDTIAPVAPQAPAAVTVACAADVPAMTSMTALDNCSGEITVEGVDVVTPGACTNKFTVTRTWTFADACGNSSSVSQTINVDDNIAPVINTLPETSTIDCPAAPAFAQATATDNCTGEVTLTFEDVRTDGECAGTYSVTRTWTATDVCGNTSTATQTINVQDITAPVISTQASNITIECDGSGNTEALNQWLASNGGAVASDTCSDVTWTNNYNGIANDCSAAVTVIFTATDACGNDSTTSATFTVQDVTAPVAPQAPAAVTVACAGDVPANVSLTATDDCAGTITVQGVDAVTPGECANSFTVVRTWTFTDACANTTSVSQTITVNDDVAPVAPAAPAAVTVVCATEVPAMVSLTATDNCNGEITVEGVDVVTPGACANSFTVTRTWTFADVCGNTSSVSQTITVDDNVAPTVPDLADLTAACADDVPAAATLTATDNCGDIISAEGVDVVTPGDCANSFTIVRTWTFTDACGNAAVATQNIIVNDETAPVAPAAPATVTVACAGDVPPMTSMTATDNCNDEITVEGVDVITPGTCVNKFTVTRTWTFADACGNTSSVSQTINVDDNIAPVAPVKLPSNITVACGSEVPETITLTATDNCSGEISAEGVDVVTPGACANSYTITRTWTFTDACNNTTVSTQIITVTDNVPPTFTETVPADISVSCDAVPTAAVLTATDSCGGDGTATVVMTETNVNNGCAGNYTLTRTWTATDTCGNTTVASQEITVMDVTNPVFVAAAPDDITVECGNVPAAAVLTATDNCGTAVVTMVEASVPGECPTKEVITRTWTATDLCGNITVETQVITVNDTTGPAIDGTLEPTVNVNCDAIPGVPELTFIDSCSAVGEASYTEEIINETAGSYTIVRTWVVADACNNESTFTQNVNVTIADSVRTINQGGCNEDISTIDLAALIQAQYPGTPTTGTWTDVSGSGALTGSVFAPFGLAVNNYVIRYEIADETCPRSIEITIAVETDCIVLPCGDITVHNAFSPNGDGINENFVITNLEQFECYPTNHVEIYNRWGVLVYETKQYDNGNNSFKGISEGRTTVNQSAELPTGTYFYLLQYTTSEGNVVKKDGYLYLSR